MNKLTEIFGHVKESAIRMSIMNKLTGIFGHVRKLAYIILVPAICYLPAYLVIKDSFSQQQSTLRNQVSDLEIKVSKLERKMPRPPVNKETEELQKDLDKTEKENLRSSLSSDLFKDLAFPVLFAIASIFAAFAVKDILTKILEDKDREKLEERLVTDITPRMKNILKKMVQDELDRSIDSRLIWIEYEIAIINSDLSVMYGLDPDKRSILEDKYKTQELATKCELDIAVIQLISNSPRMTKNVRRETIENILIPKPLVPLFSEDYFNADITVKVQRLQLMCNELKESGFLEEELIKDISKRIRELGEKSERYADVLEGEKRRKNSSTQTDWAKNQS